MDKFLVRKSKETTAEVPPIAEEPESVEHDLQEVVMEEAVEGQLLIDSSQEENEDTASTSGLASKRKLTPQPRDKGAKKHRYYCKYSTSIQQKFSWTSRSMKKVCDVTLMAKGISHEHFFFCNICQKDISMAHRGAKDITNHEEHPNHQINLTRKSMAPIHKFIQPVGMTVEEKRNAGREKFVTLLAKNNVPLSFADAFNKEVGEIFPDSDIAKDFKCGRTTTTTLLYDIGLSSRKSVIDDITGNSSMYSLSLDGGSKLLSKLYPVLVYH